MCSRSATIKKIHVIGDSHAIRFIDPSFKCYYLPGAIAYNMISDSSNTQSRAKAFEVLKGLKKSDPIMFSFGGIDCQTHLYKHVTNIDTIHVVVKRCVYRYISFIKEVQEKGYKNIIVFGPPATSPRWTEKEKTVVGTQIQRNYAVLLFTEYLSEQCKKIKVPVISIFFYLIKDNFCSDDSFYEEGMVHVIPEYQVGLFRTELRKNKLTKLL